MSENHRQYSRPVCKGSFALGTACKICDRCKDNLPSYLDQLAKENEQLKAKLLESGEGANAIDRELGRVMRERDEARKSLRWAHDTLCEINPSNYDHDEVCRLNNASVEVILGIAPLLGEKHGKTDAWWAERKQEADDAATLRTKLAAMQEAIVEADRALEQSQDGSMTYGRARVVAARTHLRPHLPTPEPEPVDPTAEDPIDALVQLLAPVLTHGQGMAARERESRFRNAMAALSARDGRIVFDNIGEGE